MDDAAREVRVQGDDKMGRTRAGGPSRARTRTTPEVVVPKTERRTRCRTVTFAGLVSTSRCARRAKRVVRMQLSESGVDRAGDTATDKGARAQGRALRVEVWMRNPRTPTS